MNCRLRRLSLSFVVLVFGFSCLRAYAVSWFPFGPDGGDARAFAADPRDPAHLYLGAANGWIYQSKDGGRKWARLARVGNRDDLVIRHILVGPANPNHLVVGAYAVEDGGGIFLSDDGGATWSEQDQMRGQSVRSLSYAPSDAKILVAGTLEGVFRSEDSGAHWERISPRGSTEIHEVESIAIDPADPNVIYAGTWHLPWKTTDGGKNWEIMKEGVIEDSDVFSILVDPKRPNVVYLSACSGIYKSEDAGGKFSGGVGTNKAQGIPSTARRTRVLMQDPNDLDTVFAGTTEGLYRTFDAGQHWIQATGSDLIVNDVYIDPANSKHVLLATDRSGVLASDDGGDSFVPSNAGFSARQITAFTRDVDHAATVYVGVVNDKDSGGVFVSHTGALSWQHLGDGLDGHDIFSLGQAPDGTILAGTEHGIYRLKDAAWQRAGGEAKTAGAAEGKAASAKTKAVRRAGTRAGARAGARQPVAKARGAAAVKDFDGSVYGFATVGETVFAATSEGLLKSASSGTAWSVVTAVPMGEWRFVASEKAEIVAAGLNALEVSADGGATWQALALPKQEMQITALAVDGRGTVWVGDRDGVYWSGDAGASWHALDDPYMRKVNSIYYDAGTDRMLVTAGSGTKAFSVGAATQHVSEIDTGWDLRFVRPVGDYLVGATLFDGMVVQPRMVDSAEIEKH